MGVSINQHYRVMSELYEVLNDDLLTCEIIKSVENEAKRVDLIKWKHDNTFQATELLKNTCKLEITDFKVSSYDEAYNLFCKKCDGTPQPAKTPHDNVGNNYQPFKY